MTDPFLSDTDGDLLSDYYEYIVLKTNPLLRDTDSNGIPDGNEDITVQILVHNLMEKLYTNTIGYLINITPNHK